jgi:hypothetical protein
VRGLLQDQGASLFAVLLAVRLTVRVLYLSWYAAPATQSSGASDE